MGCGKENFLDLVSKSMRMPKNVVLGIDRAKGADMTAFVDTTRLPDGRRVTKSVSIVKNDRGLDSIKDFFEHPNARKR